jgi:undecaprenyl-diphosphatase
MMPGMNTKRMRAVERMTAYDVQALRWLLSRPAAARAAGVARAVSRLGDGPAYVIIGFSFLLFESRAGAGFFSDALLAFALELPLYILLKNKIRRQRPADAFESLSAFIKPSDRFSFPSGHTAAAFVMATVLAVHYPLWAMLAYPVALLIGCSRVMLGVHFPTDIAAGALLGGLCAAIALSLG